MTDGMHTNYPKQTFCFLNRRNGYNKNDDSECDGGCSSPRRVACLAYLPLILFAVAYTHMPEASKQATIYHVYGSVMLLVNEGCYWQVVSEDRK